MAIFQPQVVSSGTTYTAGKGINIDEETKEISVVDPVLVNDSEVEGVVQIGNYELLSADGTIPETRLADTTEATQGQVLTLNSNLNAEWKDPTGLVTSVNGQTGAVVLNIPVNASDVHALPDSTKYGANISLSIDSSTYVVTAQLKDQNGNTLGNSQTIDLPLESVVVSGRYDDSTKKVILTLQSGSTVEFSIADLVNGLQNQIQFSVMPEASEENEGMIVQYVGETNDDYTTGYFYQCVSDDGDPATYSWTALQVQEGGSGQVQSVNGQIGEVVLAAKDVSAVPQLSELSTEDTENADAIVQYIGETDQNYTNGYFYKSQPTYSEPTVTIEKTGGPVDSISFTTISGNVQISGTVNAIRNIFNNYIGGSPKGGTITITYGTQWSSNWWNFAIHDESGEKNYPGTQSTFESNGFTFTGSPISGNTIECTYTVGNIHDLSIDENYFIAIEQPAGDETVVFSASGGSPSSATATINHSQDPNLAVSINKESYIEFITDWYGDEDMAIEEFGHATLEYIEEEGWEEEGWYDEETGEYFPGEYFPGESYWVLRGNYDQIDWIYPSDVGITKTSGNYYVGDSISISITPEVPASWKRGSSWVSLDDYGIYYEGHARAGDEISVVYTDSKITGCEWNQVNVQPGSSGNYLPLTGGTVTGRVTFDKTDCAFVAQYSQYTDKWRWKAVTSPERGLGFLSYENNDPLFTITGYGGIIPYNTSSAAQTLGDAYHSWYTVYTRRISNGNNNITIPTIAGSMAVQISNMPTASNNYVDQIYQYVGTNGTYINGRFYKCVLNSQTQTYAWEEISMGGGSGSLPDQTGQSGKFLTTDGVDASWAAPVVATFRVWEANE